MIRVLLMLLGAHYVRAWWPLHLAAGIALELAGLSLIIDAIDGVLWFPLRLFGVVLLVEGAVMMIASTSATGLRRRILFGRGLLVAVSALPVVIEGYVYHVLLAIIFGLMLAVDGGLRIATTYVVRFRGWRWSLAGGVLEIVVAITLLAPYPVQYHMTVPYVTGLACFFSGWGLVRLATRLRRLPAGALLRMLFSRGWHRVHDPHASEWSVDGSRGTLVVHVWTAEGTAEDPVARPIVSRYIAAVDRKGVVSTGHSAVEFAPHFYASHYPANDIDRSSDDFTRLLRATADNDVPGRFLPSYAVEAAQWCESTWRVRFRDFNVTRVLAWWASYSANDTYNLTNRNCSSATAHLIETALEGVVGRRNPSVLDVVRLAFSPELWLAGQFRAYAEAMAWTPGLVLDYTRSLKGALDPPPLPWAEAIQIAARAWWRVATRR